MMEWQPIESAPKDGRRIIIHAPTPAMAHPHAWGNAGWVDVVHWALRNDLGDEGWIDDDGDWSCDNATLWMPLPTLPPSPTAPEPAPAS